MVKNITKLVCDLLSSGATILEADADQIAKHIEGLVQMELPEGFWLNTDEIGDHVAELQRCRHNAELRMVNDARRGADLDIDGICTCLSQPSLDNLGEIFNSPNVSVECIGKMTVRLSGGRTQSCYTFSVVR